MKMNYSNNNNGIPYVEAIVVDDIAFQPPPTSASFSRSPQSPSAWPKTNEASARSYLSEYEFPVGLQDALIKNLSKIPIRFFICDDSGSMSTSDGNRLVSMGSANKKFVKCTRWSELSDALTFHSGLAVAACATSEFRFLNGATIRLGQPGDRESHEIVKGILDGGPGGGTPLCKHIREVTEEIRRLTPTLLASSQKACIVIATDGESSDGDLASAMRPLQSLPVWVVVRLCTDEEKIVNYWNNIDSELELEMDVLDDFKSEAMEVTSNNPWLTYGLPLHRLREFGIPIKEIDLLDEAALSPDQMRTLVACVLGGRPDSYPQPEVNWKEFIDAVNSANKAQTWCPITEKRQFWIRKTKLSSKYGSGCVIS